MAISENANKHSASKPLGNGTLENANRPILENPDKLANNLAPVRDKRTPATKAAHDNSLLKLKDKELAKMQAVDFLQLLHWLAEGKTQREISALTGVDLASVNIFINSQSGERGKALQEAKRASGEACMDKALDELEAVRGSENPLDLGLARELARHYEKRAALRNGHAFNERMQIAQATQQQVQPAQLPSFTLTILTGQQVKVEQDVIDVTPENANP